MNRLEDIAYFKDKLLTLKTMKVCMWPFMNTHSIERRKSAATRYLEMLTTKWNAMTDINRSPSYDPFEHLV